MNIDIFLIGSGELMTRTETSFEGAFERINKQHYSGVIQRTEAGGEEHS